PAPTCCSLTATATAAVYTLSLHDALPIFAASPGARHARRSSSVTIDSAPDSAPQSARSPCATNVAPLRAARAPSFASSTRSSTRSEEHTSELQSRENLVCRLLLEKKNRGG